MWAMAPAPRIGVPPKNLTTERPSSSQTPLYRCGGGCNTGQLPSLIWGGVFFVGVEFVVHAILRTSGKPNFFTGQLRESQTTV